MFAYILTAPNTPPNEQTDQFFRKFKETPGLKHAFELEGIDTPGQSVVVAVWENREAAEAYLSTAPLRREVDQSLPAVTRTMFDVRNSK
jgi:heme-degrading monooxygenase HmoA